MDSLTTRNIRTTQALTIIGAAVIVLGSFMPWVTARAVLVGQVSYTGLEGDGVLTLVLGGAIAAAAWLRMDNPGWRAAMLIGCILTVLIAVSAGAGVSDAGNQVVHTSVGGGVYLVTVGAVLAGVAVLVDMTRKM